MLTWDDKPEKDLSGKILSMTYMARIPHWGEARIHPHIHHPGEMFLDCPALGIETHPLGRACAIDAMLPAERALLAALKERRLVPGRHGGHRQPRRLTGPITTSRRQRQ